VKNKINETRQHSVLGKQWNGGISLTEVAFPMTIVVGPKQPLPVCRPSMKMSDIVTSISDTEIGYGKALQTKLNKNRFET